MAREKETHELSGIRGRHSAVKKRGISWPMSKLAKITSRKMEPIE